MKKTIIFFFLFIITTLVFAQATISPQRLLAFNDDFTIHLSWDAPSSPTGLTSYKIYKNNSLLTTIPSYQTYFEDTEFQFSESYAYKITALYSNPVSESEPSNTFNLTAVVNPENNPVYLRTNQIKRDVKLFWETQNFNFIGDDFQNPNPDTRWTLIDQDQNSHPWFISKETPASTNYCMKSEAMYNNTPIYQNNWLITPRLDLSDYTMGYAMSVKSAYSVLKIYYSSTNSNLESFMLLDSLIIQGDSWNQFDLSFNGIELNQIKYMAIVHEGNNLNDVLLDNFSFMIVTSASQERQLLGFNIYQNGNRINQTPVNPDSMTYLVQDLPNGDYLFEIKSVNENGEQGLTSANVNIAGPIYFSAYPYYINFEDGQIPDNWEIFSNDSFYDNWMINNYSGEAHNSNKSLISLSHFIDFSSYGHSLTPDNLFISPILDVPIENLTLKISYYAKSYGMDSHTNYQLNFFNGDYGINDICATITDSVSSEWELKEVYLENLVNGPVSVAWRHNDTESLGLLIDDITISLVNSTDKPELPIAKTALSQNYPNPFNPNTSISFDLCSANHVEIDIYNSKGQHVKSLLNSNLNQGKHLVCWDGKDNNNTPCSSGIYFYKMKTGSDILSKKMLLLK